jgi:hypothetical protein
VAEQLPTEVPGPEPLVSGVPFVEQLPVEVPGLGPLAYGFPFAEQLPARSSGAGLPQPCRWLSRVSVVPGSG